MKTVNIEQGTKEWLDVRSNSCCASDSSAMMGVSPYKTRTELLDEKKGVKAEISEYQQALFDRGHEVEAKARELLEFETMSNFSPIVCTKEIQGMPFLASLDGYSSDTRTVFEHKLFNQDLIDGIKKGEIAEHYKYQMEHQLMVSGADKVIFICSDGTAENREQIEYYPDPELREKLISGWKQFMEDLKNHKPRKRKSASKKDSNLPSFEAGIIGGDIITNFDSILSDFKELAKSESNKELVTDDDFSNREQLTKDIKKARANLKEKVNEVKSEFITLAQFEAKAKEIDSILQKIQSEGEKLVKEKKEEIKKEINDKAVNELEEYFNKKSNEILGYQIDYDKQLDFYSTMKNKKKIDSIIDSVNDEVAKEKIIINEYLERVSTSGCGTEKGKSISGLLSTIYEISISSYESAIEVSGDILFKIDHDNIKIYTNHSIASIYLEIAIDKFSILGGYMIARENDEEIRLYYKTEG